MQKPIAGWVTVLGLGHIKRRLFTLNSAATLNLANSSFPVRNFATVDATSGMTHQAFRASPRSHGERLPEQSAIHAWASALLVSRLEGPCESPK